MSRRKTTSEGDVRLGVLESLVGYHLRRASAVFGTDFTRTLGGDALRQVPFAVLSVVCANPGIRQGAAGNLLGIQRANMVALVNELVEAGLIERSADEGDRRAFALTPTEAGSAELARLSERLLAHEDALLRGFSAGERASLVAALRRIEVREQPVR